MKLGWRKVLIELDWHILGVALALSLLGVAFIWSASYDYRTFSPSTFSKKQVLFCILALFVMLFFAFFPYKRLGKLSFLLYGLVVGFTLVAALVMILSNLIVDILYCIIDPRVRMGRRTG